MKMIKPNFLSKPLAFVSLSACLMLSSCATVPKPEEIPMDSTVIELSQKGQSALDANNYKAAEVYYQTIIDRYGSDTGVSIAAQFEIAHLRLKKKNYKDAEQRLTEIISAYKTTGGTSLPPEYLILAQNDLARIPDKERTNTNLEKAD